jgi:hypothetical protein
LSGLLLYNSRLGRQQRSEISMHSTTIPKYLCCDVEHAKKCKSNGISVASTSVPRTQIYLKPLGIRKSKKDLDLLKELVSAWRYCAVPDLSHLIGTMLTCIHFGKVPSVYTQSSKYAASEESSAHTSFLTTRYVFRPGLVHN